MTDDREAQVRKLAEQIRGIPLASEYPEIVARGLYDAGARIPDPPPPPKVTLPVVSERTVNAFWQAYGLAAAYQAEAGLRAAFAVILEDTAAAVAKRDKTFDGYVVFRSAAFDGGAVPIEALLATLTGKAP